MTTERHLVIDPDQADQFAEYQTGPVAFVVDDAESWRHLAEPCPTCGDDLVITECGKRIHTMPVSARWITCPECHGSMRRVEIITDDDGDQTTLATGCAINIIPIFDTLDRGGIRPQHRIDLGHTGATYHYLDGNNQWRSEPIEGVGPFDAGRWAIIVVAIGPPSRLNQAA
jgi:hypothetical protein